MLVLNLTKGNIPVAPIIIISLVTAFILWVLLDTRYVIKNNFLLYRSGPIRGRVDITKIKSIKRFSGLNVPVMSVSYTHLDVYKRQSMFKILTMLLTMVILLL